MINIISFSGGRTSAYMAHLFCQNDEYAELDEREFLFCDTGGEHPETYSFIRKCNDEFRLNLTCLQAEVIDNHGTSNSYSLVNVDELGFNMQLMKDISKKYGGFTNNRPHCTDKLKTVISTKYKDTSYGKKNHHTWLGIRYDEPKRLVGDHIQYDKSAYKQLRASGLDSDGISDLFISLCNDEDCLDSEYKYLEQKTKDLLIHRRKTQKSHGLRYLAEISTFTKQDVINWWAKQDFDLAIDEHLGNCVFCIKKSELKIALAEREEPLLFGEWCDMVHGDTVRLMPADKLGKGHIYRKWQTPEMIIAKFSSHSTPELRERVYKARQVDSGSCSESCEAYSDLPQQELNLIGK